jgi:hypothetical protein
MMTKNLVRFCLVAACLTLAGIAFGGKGTSGLQRPKTHLKNQPKVCPGAPKISRIKKTAENTYIYNKKQQLKKIKYFHHKNGPRQAVTDDNTEYPLIEDNWKEHTIVDPNNNNTVVATIVDFLPNSIMQQPQDQQRESMQQRVQNILLAIRKQQNN